jgi:single-stranded-DNA-specific exonuclease
MPAGASASPTSAYACSPRATPTKPRAIAQELNRLNEERRAIEAGCRSRPIEAAARAAMRAVAIVAGRGWHPGVIGIVAGRLKERLGRPAIVIALDEDGRRQGIGALDQRRRSGRGGARRQGSGLLVAGGGHAMAAG